MAGDFRLEPYTENDNLAFYRKKFSEPLTKLIETRFPDTKILIRRIFGRQKYATQQASFRKIEAIILGAETGFFLMDQDFLPILIQVLDKERPISEPEKISLTEALAHIHANYKWRIQQQPQESVSALSGNLGLPREDRTAIYNEIMAGRKNNKKLSSPGSQMKALQTLVKGFLDSVYKTMHLNETETAGLCGLGPDTLSAFLNEPRKVTTTTRQNLEKGRDKLCDILRHSYPSIPTEQFEADFNALLVMKTRDKIRWP